MSGCSFSFSVDSYAWDFDASPPVRTLRKVKLYDAGPVTYPAYPDTSVACRSLEASRPLAADPLALHKARLKLAGAF
jgi:phage head maturation protease